MQKKKQKKQIDREIKKINKYKANQDKTNKIYKLRGII